MIQNPCNFLHGLPLANSPIPALSFFVQQRDSKGTPTVPESTCIYALRFHQQEDKLGQEHSWDELTLLAFHFCFETRRSLLKCMTGLRETMSEKKIANDQTAFNIPTKKVSTGVSISFTPHSVRQESQRTKAPNFEDICRSVQI